MQKLIIPVLILFFTGACSHNRVAPGMLTLTDDISMRLLSPASFGKNLSLTQSIEFQYQGETRELLTQSEFSKQQLVVVGLTTTGTRLFTISYDGERLNSEGYSEITENLQPKYMLADIQLSLWPVEIVNQQLQSSSICFRKKQCSFTESADKLQRTLVQNDETILTIRYLSTPHHKSKIELTNRLRQYQLTIMPLAVDEL